MKRKRKKENNPPLPQIQHSNQISHNPIPNLYLHTQNFTHCQKKKKKKKNLKFAQKKIFGDRKKI